MMKDFLKKLENHLVASTFAEANEHDTAKEYLTLKSVKNPNKKVLYTQYAGDVSAKNLNHLINLCGRIETGLEIFHFLPVKSDNKKFQNQVDKCVNAKDQYSKFGIIYQFFFGSESFGDEVNRYVNKRNDIFTIVLQDLKNKEEIINIKNSLAAQFKYPILLFSEI